MIEKYREQLREMIAAIEAEYGVLASCPVTAHLLGAHERMRELELFSQRADAAARRSV